MRQFTLVEENIIHNSNCLDIIEQLPDNFIDVIITDFPYGIDFQSNHREVKFDKIFNDEEPYIDWIKPVFNKMKEGGRLVCFYRYDVQKELFDALKDAGFKIKSQLVWNKIGTGMGDLEGEFAPQHELMVYATKGRYIFKNGRPSTVYTVQKVTGQNLVHPNEKPVDLNRLLIRDICEEGDILFEPFSGSGSLPVAAKMEKIDFIACELDINHVTTGNQRLLQAVVGMF